MQAGKMNGGEDLGPGRDDVRSESNTPAIHVGNLHKSYDSAHVLNGVNLDVNQGQFYALMGPNGSGKSTLAAIIASVVDFDSGTVEVFAKKPADARKSFGYVPQDNFSIPLLTGRENLIYFAGVLGYSGREVRAKADELLAKVGLTADANKRASQYSGGMRKRLELATVLFPGIKLLILDEPTTGLDPAARRDFLNLVKGTVDRGTSILLITHLGTDAEQATRVGLMYKGGIVAEDTPEALKRTYATVDVITVETSTRSPQVAHLLEGYSRDGKLAETQTGYHIYARDAAELVPDVIHALDRAGVGEKRIEVSTATLEDVFFRLTEHPMNEVGGQ
ncbi:MAG: ABC transporter ATP-binding protein [Nitrososphaerales archaeon]|jgi:ABC-2 type transport system ATP-binding protein